MSNLNASKPNCVCLIMNVSATELPNFVRKCYLIHELLIFKYWRQNISVSNIASHRPTAVRHSGVQPTGHVRHCIILLTHETPDFITPALWPASSPHLNPVDTRFGGSCRIVCTAAMWRRCLPDSPKPVLPKPDSPKLGLGVRVRV